MNILKSLKPLAKAPYIILIKSLTLLASLSTKSTTALQQLSKNLKKSSTYQLVPINQMPGFTKIAETHGGIENIYLPRIVGLSNGGNISVNMPGDYLCKLNNVSLVAYSDFIRDNNGYVSNEKLFRKEFDVAIPRDRDILEINGSVIKLLNKKNRISSKIAFNLIGTSAFQWAHFMAQYYPKLHFLNDLPKEEKIDLIILKDIDLHIKYLIENELINHPLINIVEVDEETEISCEKLYHVFLGTFVADDGYFPTPFSIQISNSTLNFWDKKTLDLVSKDVNQYRKIFIGRTGSRSLKNYTEVLNYFIKEGFEEIFPHLLNIEDKIKIFSEAKYIVGPGSSGFVNTNYSQSGTKILAFINSFRYLDTYLPSFSNYKKHEFWFMTGKDTNLNEMNSDFEISLNDIKQFLKENNFIDKQDKFIKN